MEEKINLSHGSGFKASREIIDKVIKKYLGNQYLDPLYDSALLSIPQDKIAFTTDSYTVSPIFFPGSDIGELAVYGTVNDLSVMAAEPKYISLGIILEEGFLFKDFEKIIVSIKKAKDKAGVQVVCGDFKVVPSGKADKIFINTSGIGIIQRDINPLSIKPGDVLIVNGPLGEHEIAVLLSRGEFDLDADIKSDCAPLSRPIKKLIEECNSIKFMRDLTRGGLGVALNELAGLVSREMLVKEERVPFRKQVRAVCDLWGYDPFFLANEGRFIMVISEQEKAKAIGILKKQGFDSCSVIGSFSQNKEARVIVETPAGGKRVLDYPYFGQFPRIC